MIAPAAFAALPSQLDLMPLPQSWQPAAGSFPISHLHTASIRGAAGASFDRVWCAVQRMEKRMGSRTGAEFEPIQRSLQGQGDLAINISSDASTIGWREDEQYSLHIDARGIRLGAASPVAALRGLATLTQLLGQGGPAQFPNGTLEDAPRFPWRGLLIDVGRHFEPVAVIERELDGMELVKLNVLHLHLTENQGFRVQSLTHPELTRLGSDGLFYTQADIRALLRYAWERGIRIMPEFDLPGHVTALAVSHPELISAPGPYRIERKWGVFDPALDPTNPALYPFLRDFLGEMAALFPDPFMHVGGDENNGVQWNANAKIQAFIRAHDLKDNAGLQTYFEQKLSQILTGDRKRMVGWDEILQPGLPRDSVIESWRGADGVVAAAHAGHDVILAHGFYIDLGFPASDHYLTEPLPAGSGLSPEEQRHVLGGEATMWGEWVSPGTIDSRIWPRTAAIAERLWSASNVRDISDMYRRLEVVDRRLAEAGLQQEAEPLQIACQLAGPGASGDAVQSIVAVATALGPMQGYTRGGKGQPGMDQTHPLTTLADVVVPDEAAARHFNLTLDRAFRHRLLLHWRDAARTAAAFAAQAHQPELADAANNLRRACDLALTPQASGARPDLSAQLAALAQPHGATLLAILPGIQSLLTDSSSTPP
ncbi:MAG TPA: family 20 glycosylhydrolase [Opitutaceae bacterium]